MLRAPAALGWLARAASVYDHPPCPLRAQATAALAAGWGGANTWMRSALCYLRQRHLRQCPEAMQMPAPRLARLLAAKYLFCLLSAGLAAALLWPLVGPLALLALPLAFYALESQGVFLVPLGLDQPHARSIHLARRSLAATQAAGGTLRVMPNVMVIAASMLLGGFVGRGFVRSWCLGCLAVCLWYEDLDLAADDEA